MFCKCENDGDAIFCKHCGRKIESINDSQKQKYVPKTKHTKIPLKTDEEIREMQRVLATSTSCADAKVRTARRNFILFSLGISFGLKSSEITSLKVSHFFTEDFKPRPQLRINERSYGNEQIIDINQEISEMLMEYIEEVGLSNCDYLAWSQREREKGEFAGEMALAPHAWNRIISTAASKLGWPKELYGGHTLRKTYGYHLYKNASAISKESGYHALSLLCKKFNQSSEAVTLCYIGIEPEEIMDVCNLTVNQFNLVYEKAGKIELSNTDED